MPYGINQHPTKVVVVDMAIINAAAIWPTVLTGFLYLRTGYEEELTGYGHLLYLKGGSE